MLHGQSTDCERQRGVQDMVQGGVQDMHGEGRGKGYLGMVQGMSGTGRGIRHEVRRGTGHGEGRGTGHGMWPCRVVQTDDF